eukprot:767532-Hanusia_phi.AAC.3
MSLSAFLQQVFMDGCGCRVCAGRRLTDLGGAGDYVFDWNLPGNAPELVEELVTILLLRRFASSLRLGKANTEILQRRFASGCLSSPFVSKSTRFISTCRRVRSTGKHGLPCSLDQKVMMNKRRKRRLEGGGEGGEAARRRRMGANNNACGDELESL